MSGTFRIGRILGIPVRLHWSLLLIGALLTVSLAAGRLVDAFPGRPDWVYWAVGLTTAVLFFSSVLAHEVGHAVVARRFGVATDTIDLWLLGGIAKLRAEAPSPRAELAISAAGPGASLLCAAAFAGAALSLDALGASGIVPSAFAWLAVVNLILAVFNVLPAAPLDGGRILQAVIWARTGDRHRAGAISAKAGVALGAAIIAFGLWELTQGGPGLFTALIGWFILTNSRMEQGVHQARGALAALRVRDAMSAGWLRYPVWTPVEGVLADRKAVRPGDVIVVEGEDRAVLGFVTFAQLANLAPEDLPWVRLGDLVVPVGTATRASADEPLVDALARVTAMLPVITVWDGPRLIGVVTGHEVREAHKRAEAARTAQRSRPAGVTGRV